MTGPRWIEEAIHHASATQRLLAQRVLLDKRGVQDVLVFQNPLFGRVLVLDGAVQTTERDEFVYHEMIAHVPLFAHGSARHVLIVGGGDGGTLREVLRHRSVESATLVEIDRDVIDASRAHLPTVHAGAFDDPRAELVIEDGFGFVRRTAKRFDVIIVDSTDPRGAAWRLFTTAFYGHCRERLSEGGILVAQAGVPFMQPDELTMVTDRLGHVLRDVSAYTAAVPTYYGGSIAFAWGCDDHARRTTEQETLARRFADAAIATRYYAPDVHLAAFVLPRFMRELIQPHP